MTTSGKSEPAATELAPPPPAGRAGWSRRRWLAIAAWVVALALLGLIAAYASRGADATRIANPAVLDLLASLIPPRLGPNGVS